MSVCLQDELLEAGPLYQIYIFFLKLANLNVGTNIYSHNTPSLAVTKLFDICQFERGKQCLWVRLNIHIKCLRATYFSSSVICLFLALAYFSTGFARTLCIFKKLALSDKLQIFLLFLCLLPLCCSFLPAPFPRI